jgi:predicted DNA-binding transcriptional regulator YafY
MTTSTRLLTALSLLQSRRFWTGGELAERLGVTERCVRRDVLRLRELGYPVHATSGVGGGYALGAGRDLPPLPLDDDEAVAVAIGLGAVAVGYVGGLESVAVSALAKLEQVLPKRLRRRLGAVQAVAVGMTPSAARVGADVLAALSNACRDEMTVRFTYVDRGGARTARNVEPYRLVHGQRWYLLAFDLDRADWRTFRVDRIAAPITARQRFKPRPLPAEDVAAYVAAAVGPDTWRLRARVTVHEPAESLRARIPAVHGQITPIDAGRSELVLGGDDVAWIAAWLGILGFAFEVHEPPELIEHCRDLAARFAHATPS